MREKPEETIQDISTPTTEKLPLESLPQQWSNTKSIGVAGLLFICVLGIGYLLLQSNMPDQAATQLPTVKSTATPVVIVNTPTLVPTASPEPTTLPAATKKQAKPTPTAITGVDMRFVDVHFEPHPEPNKGYTPFRVANGGNITVTNEKHVSEFELFAVYVNYGTEESKNVWMHYYVDNVEVKKGLAYLPGNMVRDELVTRDSAQPVMIPASGTHTIKIVMDPENESKDVNVSNNTYTFTYTVQ